MNSSHLFRLFFSFYFILFFSFWLQGKRAITIWRFVLWERLCNGWFAATIAYGEWWHSPTTKVIFILFVRFHFHFVVFSRPFHTSSRAPLFKFFLFFLSLSHTVCFIVLWFLFISPHVLRRFDQLCIVVSIIWRHHFPLCSDYFYIHVTAFSLEQKISQQ